MRTPAQGLASGPGPELNPTQRKFVAAVEQLRKSERGEQALKDFGGLLRNGGSGLDCMNWEALAALCEVCCMAGPAAAIHVTERYFKRKGGAS